MRSEGISFRGEGCSPTFHDVLSDFKQRGCNILVTGRVSETTTNRTTMQLLGASTEERKRVLVLTDTLARYANSKLPGGTNADDPDVWVIDWGDDERAVSRSVAAPSRPSEFASPEGRSERSEAISSRPSVSSTSGRTDFLHRNCVSRSTRSSNRSNTANRKPSSDFSERSSHSLVACPGWHTTISRSRTRHPSYRS